MTQTYLNQQATTAPFASREASAAGRLRPNAHTVNVKYTDYATTSTESESLSEVTIGHSSDGYRCLKKKMNATRPSPKPCAIIPGMRLLRHKATIVKRLPISRTGTNRIQPW